MELDELKKDYVALVAKFTETLLLYNDLRGNCDILSSRLNSLITSNNTQYVLELKRFDKIEKRIDYLYEKLKLD